MQSVSGVKDLSIEFLQEQSNKLSNEAFKVLAFANGEFPEEKNINISNLTGLNFLGLFGMIDPLREDAKESILKAKQIGLAEPNAAKKF